MDTEDLRKRAQHLRKLAKLVADERTSQAALRLAADCDHHADALENDDGNSVVSNGHSSAPEQCTAEANPFTENGDKLRTNASMRLYPRGIRSI